MIRQNQTRKSIAGSHQVPTTWHGTGLVETGAGYILVHPARESYQKSLDKLKERAQAPDFLALRSEQAWLPAALST